MWNKLPCGHGAAYRCSACGHCYQCGHKLTFEPGTTDNHDKSQFIVASNGRYFWTCPLGLYKPAVPDVGQWKNVEAQEG